MSNVHKEEHYHHDQIAFLYNLIVKVIICLWFWNYYHSIEQQVEIFFWPSTSKWKLSFKISRPATIKARPYYLQYHLKRRRSFIAEYVQPVATYEWKP